jgi:DNA-binding MarR family transcriptional regulator
VPLTNNPDQTGSGADGGRDGLIAELVGEMTNWSPRERGMAFRSWLKGSLSLIHLHVLSVLEGEGPLPMSRLAETLDVSVASTTGIISRMEERGLVERSHGEADRRVVLVHATPSGLAIFSDMTEQRRIGLGSLLERLTDDELASLLIGLRAMRAARAALHVEKLASGLVSVTLRKDESADAGDRQTDSDPGHTGRKP